MLQAYAEKLRAALTRKIPAIRDFFDADIAVRSRTLRPFEKEMRALVRKMLAVPGKDPIDTSETETGALREQLGPQLEPVLRRKGFEAFVLDRALDIVNEVAKRCS